MRIIPEVANIHTRFGSPTEASSSKKAEVPCNPPSRPASSSPSRVSESSNIRSSNQIMAEDEPKATPTSEMDPKMDRSMYESEANSYTLGSKDTATSQSHVSGSSLTASAPTGMVVPSSLNSFLTPAASIIPTGELGKHTKPTQEFKAVAPLQPTANLSSSPPVEVDAEHANAELADAELANADHAEAEVDNAEAADVVAGEAKMADAEVKQTKGKQPLLGSKSRDTSCDPPKYKNIARNKRNKKQSPAKTTGRPHGNSKPKKRAK